VGRFLKLRETRTRLIQVGLVFGSLFQSIRSQLRAQDLYPSEFLSPIPASAIRLFLAGCMDLCLLRIPEMRASRLLDGVIR